jgi:hypothetical protein
MRIPSNIIKENQYTIGKEYMYLSSYKEYQGYYYEINNKFYVGKTFNENAPELIKTSSSDKINILLTQPSTYVFGKLSNIKIINTPFSSIVNKVDLNARTRYFAKKLNNNPILIREVNKNNFYALLNDPIYQTISLDFPEGGYFGTSSDLDEAEKQMPGIKTFILSELPPD